jgi:hypothetical protein
VPADLVGRNAAIYRGDVCQQLPRRFRETTVSEQPTTGDEQAESTEQSWTAQHPHVVTDSEAAVDDALGSTDNPH